MDGPELTAVSKPVKVTLSSGVEIHVEASNAGIRSGEVGNWDEKFSFENFSKGVGEIANTLKAALEQAKPTKVSVELGLQVGVQPGKLIAVWVQGDTKANVKVTLEWS